MDKFAALFLKSILVTTFIFAFFAISGEVVNAWGSDCCTGPTRDSYDPDYTYTVQIDENFNVDIDRRYNPHSDRNNNGERQGSVSCQFFGSEGNQLRCTCPDGSRVTGTSQRNALNKCPRPEPPQPTATCSINPRTVNLSMGQDFVFDVYPSRPTNNGTTWTTSLNGSRIGSGSGGGNNYRLYEMGVPGNRLTNSGAYTFRASFSRTGYNSYSCKANINVENDAAPPTANLRVRNTSTGGSWTGSNITIDYNDQVALNWSSSNATVCTASGSGFSTGNSTGGTDTSINEPAAGSSRTYRVTCSGPGGTANDSITVTRRDPPPTATLRVRNTTTGTSWSTSNITIEPTEQVALNWSSTNSNSCGGTNYSTGGSTSGTQNSVTEPNPGTSRVYGVTCTGPGGSGSDSLRVTTNAWDPVDITADPGYVHSGDSADLEWTLGNNPADLCTLEGPNVSGTLSSYTEPHTVTINGESEFTLTCPGGSDTATIRVLPVIEET